MEIMPMKPQVIPKALTAQVLRMAQNELGHDGTYQTYMLLKRLIIGKDSHLSYAVYFYGFNRCVSSSN